MTEDAAFTAERVGQRVRPSGDPPWEVFGERLRRFEIHLNGDRVEMLRAPVQLEGFGLRVFRSVDEQTAVGIAASTDLSDAGIARALAEAESGAKYARFPARRIELPGGSNRPGTVEIVDPDLWARPVETIEAFLHGLLAPFARRKDEQPSFGSVRVTLAETTLANSEGIQRRFSHTKADLEFAVKATGGAEGRPAGEWWVTRSFRRLPSPEAIAAEVPLWCQKAQDARHGTTPATGATTVVLPPGVLADILPPIISGRLSGAAQLRKMMPPVGSMVGAPNVTLVDDGLLPYGLGTSPCDHEGTPPTRRPVIEGGIVRGVLYDVLHGGAFGTPSTGNGRREEVLFPNWFHFATPPGPSATNLALQPGDGGTAEELVESVADGIWVEQLGYAFPDPVSGAFGGELRLAYRIRNGKRAEPLRGGTLGGVVFAPPGEPSLLTSMSAIGSAPELCGFLRSPACVVQGMTVAGG
jgi:predicted Zn-dependent protease